MSYLAQTYATTTVQNPTSLLIVHFAHCFSNLAPLTAIIMSNRSIQPSMALLITSMGRARHSLSSASSSSSSELSLRIHTRLQVGPDELDGVNVGGGGRPLVPGDHVGEVV